MNAVVAILVESVRDSTRTFFATVSQCFPDDSNKLLRKRDARGDYFRRFCVPYGDQRFGSFH